MLQSRFALVLAVALTMSTSFALAKKGGDCCSDGGSCKPAFKQSKGKAKPGSACGACKVTITQSGGIAGINSTFSADGGALKKPEEKKMAELISATGVLKVNDLRKTTSGAADMFFYQFEVGCQGTTHKATFDDGTLPQSYRALLDFVKTASK